MYVSRFTVALAGVFIAICFILFALALAGVFGPTAG